MERMDPAEEGAGGETTGSAPWRAPAKGRSPPRAAPRATVPGTAAMLVVRAGVEATGVVPWRTPALGRAPPVAVDAAGGGVEVGVPAADVAGGVVVAVDAVVAVVAVDAVAVVDGVAEVKVGSVVVVVVESVMNGAVVAVAHAPVCGPSRYLRPRRPRNQSSRFLPAASRFFLMALYLASCAGVMSDSSLGTGHVGVM